MKKSVTIIGGGPSAFLLAAFLDADKFDVTIYEKNKSAGRKFLVAGKGGFNLTHSESIAKLTKRYTPQGFLDSSLLNFTNTDFRDWLGGIGIPTYIGSSKRIYPKEGIKPIEVLNAILNSLKEKGTVIKYEQVFTDWDMNNHPVINKKSIPSDYTVFSLGGKSWKVTGSDGNWLDSFDKKGIETIPFQASNCAFKIDWKKDFIQQNEGKPLKNIAISCSGKTQKGEAVITKFGLEGNAMYALSPQVRNELLKHKKASLYIDLKPVLTLDNLLSKISKSNCKNTTETLKRDIKLSSSQINLLKSSLSKEQYLETSTLAQYIKKLPIEVIGTAPIDEAISTVGGISLGAVNEHFELQTLANQYCIGEMLDWDAPTGGYLLQACVSIGVHLAKHLNKINSVF